MIRPLPSAPTEGTGVTSPTKGKPRPKNRSAAIHRRQYRDPAGQRRGSTGLHPERRPERPVAVRRCSLYRHGASRQPRPVCYSDLLLQGNLRGNPRPDPKKWLPVFLWRLPPDCGTLWSRRPICSNTRRVCYCPASLGRICRRRRQSCWLFSTPMPSISMCALKCPIWSATQSCPQRQAICSGGP